MEGYVTTQDIQDHFRISKSTVAKWRKQLGLPSHRFGKGKRGGTVLFKMSEVALWETKYQPRRTRS